MCISNRTTLVVGIAIARWTIRSRSCNCGADRVPWAFVRTVRSPWGICRWAVVVVLRGAISNCEQHQRRFFVREEETKATCFFSLLFRSLLWSPFGSFDRCGVSSEPRPIRWHPLTPLPFVSIHSCFSSRTRRRCQIGYWICNLFSLLHVDRQTRSPRLNVNYIMCDCQHIVPD